MKKTKVILQQEYNKPMILVTSIGNVGVGTISPDTVVTPNISSTSKGLYFLGWIFKNLQDGITFLSPAPGW
ncbi:hypothetical protein [Chryseobacterium indologenes]|jgi:hypothetical protein|uniref:hypothetical protein n=1 Tax=Chryseobacterium indologenes TaxID=253 RepID=UPI0006473522|nr:hypothetical protein [Chryseobacterium indologenes]